MYCCICAVIVASETEYLVAPILLITMSQTAYLFAPSKLIVVVATVCIVASVLLI